MAYSVKSFWRTEIFQYYSGENYWLKMKGQQSFFPCYYFVNFYLFELWQCIHIFTNNFWGPTSKRGKIELSLKKETSSSFLYIFFLLIFTNFRTKYCEKMFFGSKSTNPTVNSWWAKDFFLIWLRNWLLKRKNNQYFSDFTIIFCQPGFQCLMMTADDVYQILFLSIS